MKPLPFFLLTFAVLLAACESDADIDLAQPADGGILSPLQLLRDLAGSSALGAASGPTVVLDGEGTISPVPRKLMRRVAVVGGGDDAPDVSVRIGSALFPSLRRGGYSLALDALPYRADSSAGVAYDAGALAVRAEFGAAGATAQRDGDAGIDLPELPPLWVRTSVRRKRHRRDADLRFRVAGLNNPDEHELYAVICAVDEPCLYKKFERKRLRFSRAELAAIPSHRPVFASVIHYAVDSTLVDGRVVYGATYNEYHSSEFEIHERER